LQVFKRQSVVSLQNRFEDSLESAGVIRSLDAIERGAAMRPKERQESGAQHLFRARLDQIIELDHALVRLAPAIDWRLLEDKFGVVYTDEPGRPPLPTRLMAGMAILKHSYNLSDEVLGEQLGGGIMVEPVD
jgi:hypothetical protein